MPRFLNALLAVSLLAALSPAFAADGPNLRVVATNVQSDGGKIVVWVYGSADSWLKDDGVRTQKSVPVQGNRSGDSVTVELLLPPGDYALSVFHDLEGDGRLERNFIGLPKEPAGLSNNVRPRFGPPRFDKAKFTIGTDVVEQRIELR